LAKAEIVNFPATLGSTFFPTSKASSLHFQLTAHSPQGPETIP